MNLHLQNRSTQRSDSYLANEDPKRLLEVDGGNGRNFIARVLLPGSAYGREGCLIWGEGAGRGVADPVLREKMQQEFGQMPGVEIYDATRKDDPRFSPLGQFTGGRYYLQDFLPREGGVPQRGLMLDGGIPEWSLSAAAYAQVVEWVKGVLQVEDAPVQESPATGLRGVKPKDLAFAQKQDAEAQVPFAATTSQGHFALAEEHRAEAKRIGYPKGVRSFKLDDNGKPVTPKDADLLAKWKHHTSLATAHIRVGVAKNPEHPDHQEMLRNGIFEEGAAVLGIPVQDDWK